MTLNPKSPVVQHYILNYGHRLELIDWLEWCDSNGTFSDADCEIEDMQPADTENLRAIMRTMLEL